FKGVSLEAAIQAFQMAPEGSYIVLENPADGDKHPSGTGKLTIPALKIGKRVNIPGPACFALWPGQSAKVLAGHNLRSNEFVLCRVYDEEAARSNWSKQVVKTQLSDAGGSETPQPAAPKKGHKDDVAAARASTDIPTVDALTMGKLFVIRGTEV